MGIVPVDSNCRPPGEIFVDACLAARSGDRRSLRMNGMSKNGQEKKIERLTVKMLLLPSTLFCMQLDNTCGPQSRNVAMSDQEMACSGMSEAFGVAEG
jgi:hypothetical protein